jgi:isopentenyl-diphosphate Delta-isomerase
MVDARAQEKLDHLETVLQRNVLPSATTTGFECVRFVHNALPEMDFATVDVSTRFLGRTLSAPLLISSMTGGPKKSGQINTTLAEIAQALSIALAVGSQRIALETPHAAGFESKLRRLAPDIPILANIGAAQLREDRGVDYLRRAVEMIEADALIVHLNPLQEVLQHTGDRNWHGILGRIEVAVRALPCPVIIKEIGCGISAALALRLEAVGVTIIDVAGAGGTSWAAVVADRAPSTKARRAAETFRDWGIPTAIALSDVRRACPNATLIASGGMRTGLDAAKAIRLGADMVGFAGSILPNAVEGRESLRERFEAIIDELRITAFCTGSASLSALKHAPLCVSTQQALYR